MEPECSTRAQQLFEKGKGSHAAREHANMILEFGWPVMADQFGNVTKALRKQHMREYLPDWDVRNRKFDRNVPRNHHAFVSCKALDVFRRQIEASAVRGKMIGIHGDCF